MINIVEKMKNIWRGEKKFIQILQNNYKDLLYVWTLECSDKLHMHILLNIEYSNDLRSKIRKKW